MHHKVRKVGKHYINVKIPPTITVGVCYYYKLAEQWTLGLGRFLECQKCNIIISYNTGTRALSDIYILALGCRAFISGNCKALLPVL